MNIKMEKISDDKIEGVHDIPIGRFFDFGWCEKTKGRYTYLRTASGALLFDDSLIHVDLSFFGNASVSLLAGNYVAWFYA